MKLSFKNILPILSIFTLLILFAGCTTPSEEQPGYAPYNLTMLVSPIGGGITSPAVGIYPYDEGIVVNLTATAASGYHFVKWIGDATGSVNPTTVTMDADKTVTAIFAAGAADEITYTLTTAVDPAGSGTVTGAGSYNAGETATVKATAATCYVFDHWSGDLSGNTNPTTILMDGGDKSVTAHFVKNVAPYFTSTAITEAVGGASYYYDADATDPEGHTLTYAEGTNWPYWLSLNTSTGVISGTAPCCEDLRNTIPTCDWPVDVDVSDECTAVTQSFTIKVKENALPEFNNIPGVPEVVLGGTDYSFDASATDPDSSPLVYSEGANWPYWLDLDTSTGEISGKAPCPPDCSKKGCPECCDPCFFDVDVKVSDECSTVELSFKIKVECNKKPNITSWPGPGVWVCIGSNYEYYVTASDSDSADLTFDLGKHPETMTITKTGPKTATVEWIGTCSDAQKSWPPPPQCTYNVEVKVSDECSEKVQSYTIYVYNCGG